MRRFFLPFVFALTFPIALGLLDINCFTAVCNNFISCQECLKAQPDPRVASFMCLREYGCIDTHSHWLIGYSDAEFKRCLNYNVEQYGRLCENQRHRLTNITVLRA